MTNGPSKLNPATALGGLVGLVLIGISAIVGLTLADRDPAQVIYFLAPIVALAVPQLIAALRNEQVSRNVDETATKVDQILNGGAGGMRGVMRSELDVRRPVDIPPGDRQHVDPPKTPPATEPEPAP